MGMRKPVREETSSACRAKPGKTADLRAVKKEKQPKNRLFWGVFAHF
jgi:hypothetical protein